MTPKEQQIFAIIKEAIVSNNLISFEYDSIYRTVEPYLLGELWSTKTPTQGKGIISLRGYHIRGFTSKPILKPEDGWRIYDLIKIKDLQVLAEISKTVKPGYNPYDYDFKEILFRYA